MIRAIALVSSLTSLVMVVPFWLRYDPAGQPFQMREHVLLIPSLGSGYDVGADGLTLLFVLLIGLVSLLAVSSRGGGSTIGKSRTTADCCSFRPR